MDAGEHEAQPRWPPGLGLAFASAVLYALLFVVAWSAVQYPSGVREPDSARAIWLTCCGLVGTLAQLGLFSWSISLLTRRKGSAWAWAAMVLSGAWLLGLVFAMLR